MSLYDYTGVVKSIGRVEEFSSGFTKRTLVLTDDIGAKTKYPSVIPFTLKKDKCALADNLSEGQRVKVRFAIDGREWTNPQGQVKYFTDLTAIGVENLSAPEAKADEPESDGDDFDAPF